MSNKPITTRSSIIVVFRGHLDFDLIALTFADDYDVGAKIIILW